MVPVCPHSMDLSSVRDSPQGLSLLDSARIKNKYVKETPTRDYEFRSLSVGCHVPSVLPSEQNVRILAASGV